MEIIRGRLSAADFSNPSQRYNSGTDTVQYTPDNGTTWIDSPEADPRHSNVFRLPALTSSDPRCDAAANMVKWIKDFIDGVIDQLNADAQALALTNSFLTTFSSLFPPALLLLLLQEAATSLFDTGAAALEAAFTSTQYDLLLCAFDCNISANGQVTAAQLTAIEVAIVATMDGTAAAIVAEILFIQGEVGLSNAGAIGSETGDCSGCDCGWTYQWNFASSDGDWFARRSDEGNYVPGTGWVGNCVTADGTAFRCVIQYNIPTAPAVEIETFDVQYLYVNGSTSTAQQKLTMREFSGNSGTGSTLATSTSGNPPPDGEDTGSLVSTQTPHSLELNVWSSNGDCSGNIIYRTASVSGHGTPPSALTGGAFI